MYFKLYINLISYNFIVLLFCNFVITFYHINDVCLQLYCTIEIIVLHEYFADVLDVQILFH